MQTFIPETIYTHCALVLDSRRLNKQRTECLQIWRAMHGMYRKPGKSVGAWENHPAVKMWKPYKIPFLHYYKYICLECDFRGIRDNTFMHDWVDATLNTLKEACPGVNMDKVYPAWWYDDAVHSSHRAALLKKNYTHYSQFGWKEEPKVEYIWPVT